MAKRPPNKPTAPKGRARERGETTAFTFEMTPELDEALEKCADLEDRTKKVILTRALERYLREAGLWDKPEKGRL